MHGKLRGKKYHAWIVRQIKFLQIIDIFQWVGWLVPIPPCSVANQSNVQCERRDNNVLPSLSLCTGR